MQHIVKSVVGASFDLEPRRMALLAKLALDAGDLVRCALPPELVMAVVAVGIKSNEASVDTGLVGRWAFELEKRALEEARQVWHDHMERGPERRTPSVIRAHLEQEGDSLPAFEPASIVRPTAASSFPSPLATPFLMPDDRPYAASRTNQPIGENEMSKAKTKKDVEAVGIVPTREDIERFSHLDTERKRVAAAAAWAGTLRAGQQTHAVPQAGRR